MNPHEDNSREEWAPIQFLLSYLSNFDKPEGLRKLLNGTDTDAEFVANLGDDQLSVSFPASRIAVRGAQSLCVSLLIGIGSLGGAIREVRKNVEETETVWA